MQDLIVVGIGQLGALLGSTALKQGVRVTPLLRKMDRVAAYAATPFDAPILVAVGEADLAPVIDEVPHGRRSEVVLLQNELFPARWQEFGLDAPTIAVAWFSKKQGRAVEVARESAVCGRHAELIASLIRESGAPCVVVGEDERNLHLVAKFAFILAINALGVDRDITLQAWLDRDRERCEAALHDGVVLGCAHLGQTVDFARAVEMGREAMEGLGDYPARGRSAVARVKRAKADGERLGLLLPLVSATDVDS